MSVCDSFYCLRWFIYYIILMLRWVFVYFARIFFSSHFGYFVVVLFTFCVVYGCDSAIIDSECPCFCTFLSIRSYLGVPSTRTEGDVISACVSQQWKSLVSSVCLFTNRVCFNVAQYIVLFSTMPETKHRIKTVMHTHNLTESGGWRPRTAICYSVIIFQSIVTFFSHSIK